MACAQKETSRGVSVGARPTRALNHWRSASIRLTAAMGAPHTLAAALASSSNAASAGVSSTW